MKRALTLFAGIACLAAAMPTAAQANGEEVGGPSNRELNNHLFLPTPFLESPFSTTHLSETIQYAYGRATGPSYNAAGFTVGGRTYTQGAVGSEVEFQFRFADFFALRLSGTAIVFTGVDTPSVLVTGASFRYNVGAGFTTGFRIGPALRLALVVDAGYQPAFDLTIAAGILKALQTGAFNSGNVFSIGQTVQVKPGLSVAWSPYRLVGLMAEARYVYTNVQRSNSEDATGNGVDMAFQLDLDFGAVSPVAIGLTGYYRLLDPISGSSRFRTEDAGGGIFYTGRRHLAAGLAVTWQNFHIRPELSTHAEIANLILRYYW